MCEQKQISRAAQRRQLAVVRPGSCRCRLDPVAHPVANGAAVTAHREVWGAGGEALAIARVLGFGLDNLVPRADLDYYLSDVERLMDESRVALATMLRSVDPVVDFVRRHPDCLGPERIEDRFREVVEWFQQRVSPDDLRRDDQRVSNFAVTTNRTDEKLKRQLLRAVTDDIIVKADDIQPAYDRWFKKDIGDGRREHQGGSATGETGRRPRRGGSWVGAEQWQEHFGQLVEYVNHHGDARVPRSYTTPDGGRLGAWVVEQRSHFARGTLDSDHSAQLQELPGWTWGLRGARRASPP